MYVMTIFVLDDGTELIGRDRIARHLHLFPKDSYELQKKVHSEILRQPQTAGINTGILRVFQSGTHSVEYMSVAVPTPVD